ncbi:hypothetical protein [Flagellimonas marina]|uniref:Uncharacterized protein n=1 Tax=Flagellimonas marina TaxID=1775168 RepID=A0ABV8PFQ4_9FLAO
MIKYELKRSKKSEGWMMMMGYESKTVTPRELQTHLKEGWTLVRKRYFLVTYITDWWKNLSTGNRISVFGIVLSTALTLAFGISNYWLSEENNNLNNKVDSLKQEVPLLKLSIDSLILNNNELKDSIKKQTEFYKEQTLLDSISN